MSAMCDSLRMEVVSHGIRVVEIMPGPVDTDMFRDSAEEVDAARYDEYRSMAQDYTALRSGADEMVVSAAEAARSIVDQIVAEGGPMRHGCDPLSSGLIDLWRTQGDEALFKIIADSLL